MDAEGKITGAAAPHSLHGRVIEFRGAGDLAIVPTRVAYCDRAEIERNNEIIAATAAAAPLLFMPICVKEITERVGGAGRYVMMLSGVLTDGRKAVVMLRGIEPYFDVRRPDDMGAEAFVAAARKIAAESSKGTFIRADIVFGRRAIGFEEEPREYCRLYFTNTWGRKEAWKYCRQSAAFSDTANDDMTHYERVVCRGAAFTMCGWNEMRRFERAANAHCILPAVFNVNVNDFIAAGAAPPRDRTIVETHDIETYSPSGAVPQHENRADDIFVIAKTYHWKDEAAALLRVCIIVGPEDGCAAVPDALVIMCRNEADLLRCSLVISGRMRPDYICGFNDGEYDWPWIIARCATHKLLVDAHDQLGLFRSAPRGGGRWKAGEQEEDIMRWCAGGVTIKIDAATTIYNQAAFRFFGYMPIDVRTVMRKLYPRAAKTSLKHFLAILGLAGKEDMDIRDMFAIRRAAIEGGGDRAAIAADMRRVAEYCITDAFRCQEIMLRTNTINDYREVSNVAHTTLYDAVYIAGGAKVRNLAYGEAARDGIMFSAHAVGHEWEGKYPGGYVYRPDMGMITPKLSIAERRAHDPQWKDVDVDAAHRYVADAYAGRGGEAPAIVREFMDERTHYPVSGLDFNALYPSIIMAYNLSPERMIMSDAQFGDMKKRGYDIYEDSFPYCGRVIKVRSVRHGTLDGTRPAPRRAASGAVAVAANHKFGLYPRILLKLKAGRVAVRKSMAAVEAELKTAEGARAADLRYRLSYLDSKQKALKVTMNTFYGESGSKSSPLFMIEVCGGITSAGRRNLRGVGEFVKGLECRLYYGDTDSVYISCPARHFREYDAAYFAGAMSKIEYCTHLVRVTFVVIDQIRAAVNEMLIADNGTEFLAMAYEEVLFPMGLLKKKSYAGVAHVREINFNLREGGGAHIFTRNMAMEKIGVSGLLKVVCGELLRECLDLDRWRDPMRIVLEKIDDIYRREWPLDNFRQSAVFRPEKANIAVATFRRRMAVRGLDVPRPNERFEYIVVVKRQKYDARGHIVKQKVADKWEYAGRVAADESKGAHEWGGGAAPRRPYRIDLAHYLKGGVVAQFAQFISYYSEFRVEPIAADGDDADDGDAVDVADKKSLEAANKYLHAVCKMRNGDGGAAAEGRILMAARRRNEAKLKQMMAERVIRASGAALGAEAAGAFVKAAATLSRVRGSCIGPGGCRDDLCCDGDERRMAVRDKIHGLYTPRTPGLYEELCAVIFVEEKIDAVAAAYGAHCIATRKKILCAAADGKKGWRMPYREYDQLIKMFSSAEVYAGRIENQLQREITENEAKFRGVLNRGEELSRAEPEGGAALARMIEDGAIVERFCDAKVRLRGVMLHIAKTKAVIAAAREAARVLPIVRRADGEVMRSAGGHVIRNAAPRPEAPRGAFAITREMCEEACGDEDSNDFGA